MTSRAVPGREARVDVWCLPLDVADDCAHTLAALLSPEERATLGRLPRQGDRRQRCVAWGIRRAILAHRLECDPRDLVFLRSPGTAPEIARPATTLRFSLSHSGRAMVLAVCDGARVGADIEQCRTRADVAQLARRFFLAAESSEIEALAAEAARERFFQIWTRKEALLKALGGGVPSRLREVSAGGATDGRVHVGGVPWEVRDISAPPGYAAAVAVEGQAAIIAHASFDLSSQRP